MTGPDFLFVARALSNESTEAAWRSSISRAYYAGFHVARDLMRHLGFTVPRSERAHTYLEQRLSNSGDPQVQLGWSEARQLKEQPHSGRL